MAASTLTHLRSLSARLSYVAGDYQDPATFDKLRQALGSAERPLFYLAIPPSLFGTVASGLARSGCAAQARVVVEKPFGRDLASAKALNATLHQSFPEPAVYRIDHFLGKEPVQNLLYFRFANAISGADLECRSRRRARKSPWRKRSACAAAAASMRASAPFGTSSRIICCRSSRCWRWTAPTTGDGQAIDAARVALLSAVRPLRPSRRGPSDNIADTAPKTASQPIRASKPTSPRASRSRTLDGPASRS